jgi:enoyl-CoA hydratase/carnithine racemase
MENLGNFKKQKSFRLSFPFETVLHIAFNRSQQLNSLTTHVFQDLLDLLTHLKHESSVRAIVLSGGDCKAFTCGLDLNEISGFPGQLKVGAHHVDNSRKKDPAREAFSFLKMVQLFQNAITALESCDKPVIAAIQGACIGGGKSFLFFLISFF